MEPEYIENHKTAELGIIHEEKEVCNQPLSETLFRGSIIFYKIQIIQVRGQCIHVFVVHILLYVLYPLFAYLNCRFYIFLPINMKRPFVIFFYPVIMFCSSSYPAVSFIRRFICIFLISYEISWSCFILLAVISSWCHL